MAVNQDPGANSCIQSWKTRAYWSQDIVNHCDETNGVTNFAGPLIFDTTDRPLSSNQASMVERICIHKSMAELMLATQK